MYTKIKTDIKEAMKSRDTVRRDCLKMVVDKAKAIIKDRYPVNTPENIPDDVMVQAIKKEIKQLNQTKNVLTGKESSDLYIKTALEIDILTEYLPKQMTRDEVDQAVFNILSNGYCPDFGSKMKAVMNELKGKADNKLIKEIVEKYR